MSRTGHFCLGSTPASETKVTQSESSLKLLQTLSVSSPAQVSNPLTNGSPCPPPNGSGTLLCGETLADGDVARLKKQQSVKERDEQIMRLKEVCLSPFPRLCVPSWVVCLFTELLQCCCSLCPASERTGMQELASKTQEIGQFTPFPRAAGFTPTDARPNAPGERSLDFGKTVV